MSLREDILSYIDTQIVAATTLPVYRSREAAVGRSEGPVFILRPTEEEPSKLSERMAIRKLSFTVTLVIRGDVPDSAADPFLVLMHAGLMADTTQGNRAAQTIEKGTRWDLETGDLTALAVEVTYEVIFNTLAKSLNALS